MQHGDRHDTKKEPESPLMLREIFVNRRIVDFFDSHRSPYRTGSLKGLVNERRRAEFVSARAV
jgi:hypothetical protein